MKKENLVKYVQLLSKPVGLIDLTDNNNTDEDSIQFVRPFTGSFDSVTIFVFLPGQVGILIQEEGDATVKITSLPDTLQELYRSAPVVQMRKRPIATTTLVEEERKVPLIIGQNPIMAKTRRRPLVAATVAAPLVESNPSNNKPKNNSRTRRKPRVAPTQVAPVANKK